MATIEPVHFASAPDPFSLSLTASAPDPFSLTAPDPFSLIPLNLRGSDTRCWNEPLRVEVPDNDGEPMPTLDERAEKRQQALFPDAVTRRKSKRMDNGGTSNSSPEVRRGNRFTRDAVTLHFEPAEKLYESWPTPTCIIVDGPYGVSGFPGDPPTVEPLVEWYRPHVEAWSRFSTPRTTLWFWGTELGWATVHPLLVQSDWEYRSCHIWDKGLGHVAGNANSLTLRKFPVVTEVCVQYVKIARFVINNRRTTMQEWVRHEWLRSGIPLFKTNEACGVKNAATRKYFTRCHLWY